MKTEKNASSHFRKPVMLKQTPSSSISPLVTPTTLMVNSVFPVDTLYLQFRKDDTPVIHTISFSTITTVEEAKRAITRKLMTHQKLELFELYLPLTGVFLLLPDRMLLSYYLRNSEEITLKKKEIPKREVTVKFPLLSETEEIVHIWKETTAMGLIQLLEKKELKNISESCLSVEGKTPLPMNEPLPIKSSIFYYVTYTTLSDNCPFLNKTNSVLWRTTHVARQGTPSGCPVQVCLRMTGGVRRCWKGGSKVSEGVRGTGCWWVSEECSDVFLTFPPQRSLLPLSKNLAPKFLQPREIPKSQFPRESLRSPRRTPPTLSPPRRMPPPHSTPYPPASLRPNP